MRHIQIFEDYLYEDAMGIEDPAPTDLKYLIFKFITESGNIFNLRFTNSSGTEAVISDISQEENAESIKPEFSKLHNEAPVLISGRGRFETGSGIEIQQLFDEYGERIMEGDEPLILRASDRVKAIEELE